MILLPTFGVSRAAGLSRHAAATLLHSRLFSSSVKEGAKGAEDQEDTASFYDIEREGRPVRTHQLIGDPRNGVADDTTQPLNGDLAIEWIWNQGTNDVNWHRYSIAGRDQLPHMHVDARLSDHSKNLMYLLRCKHPKRWTIEALASKFRVRRQRVLAILALKEIEAQAMEEGRLMAGPFSPFAFRVALSDLKTDAAGEVIDLGDVVNTQSEMQPEVLAHLQEQHQQQQQQQRQRKRQRDGKQAAGQAAAAAATPDDAFGSLEDFIQEADADGGAGRQQGGGKGATDALTQLLLESCGREHDLASVMPRLAATAQRVHLRLLQLLKNCSYDAEELRRQLISQLDEADAVWAAQVAGTPLEAALIAAARELEAAAAAAAPQQQQQQKEAVEQEQHQQEGEGEGGDAVAAAPALPRCLDFAWQRQQVEAVVAALSPLMDRAGAEEEREAARLATKLRRMLAAVDEPPPEQQQQQQPAEDATPSDAAAATDAAPSSPPPSPLQSLISSSPPHILAAAFKSMDLLLRRRLMEAAPSARAALNAAGVDLRAAADAAAAAGGGGRMTAAVSTAVGEIGGGDGSSGGGGAGASTIQQLPEWPGQSLELVDAFGYREVPSRLVEAAVSALAPLEEAAGQLRRLLRAATGHGGEDEDEVAAGGGDVVALRDAARTYGTLLWAYDKVLHEQLVDTCQGEEPPAPPATGQRRMMRILRELDPKALEKLLYWDTWERELREDPDKAARLRANIQKVINKMNERMATGATPSEEGASNDGIPDDADHILPELPRLKDATSDIGQRVSHDLLAAFIDAEVVGRQYHRGSGDRHFVRLDTYPKFEGYSLEEFDKVREGELCALSRKVAEREDDMMWREFRDRVYYNLGMSGPGLWELHGHARPQRPEEGWSWVVYDTSKHWNSKAERKKQRQQQRQQQSGDGDGGEEREYVDARRRLHQLQRLERSRRLSRASKCLEGGAVPYVARPDGALRPMGEEEAYLQRRRTPVARRRWFADNRRLGTG